MDVSDGHRCIEGRNSDDAGPDAVDINDDDLRAVLMVQNKILIHCL